MTFGESWPKTATTYPRSEHERAIKEYILEIDSSGAFDDNDIQDDRQDLSVGKEIKSEQGPLTSVQALFSGGEKPKKLKTKAPINDENESKGKGKDIPVFEKELDYVKAESGNNMMNGKGAHVEPKFVQIRRAPEKGRGRVRPTQDVLVALETCRKQILSTAETNRDSNDPEVYTKYDNVLKSEKDLVEFPLSHIRQALAEEKLYVKLSQDESTVMEERRKDLRLNIEASGEPNNRQVNIEKQDSHVEHMPLQPSSAITGTGPKNKFRTKAMCYLIEDFGQNLHIFQNQKLNGPSQGGKGEAVIGAPRLAQSALPLPKASEATYDSYKRSSPIML